MNKLINIDRFPLFEKGIFEKYPALFDRFIHHNPGNSKKKYQEARKLLPEFERTITWPMITGPGFCGATHPGSENMFSKIMSRQNSLIYNSDCLYVNPLQNVFAVSDAPGVTTSSRRLFEKLDQSLKERPINDLETIINGLDRDTNISSRATLCLVYFPRRVSENGPPKALALSAGDSYVFHGNIFNGEIRLIEGNPSFIGSPEISPELEVIELSSGDFFILASDGIDDITLYNQDTGLGETLWKQMNDGPENFVFNAIKTCNSILERRLSSRKITMFGGIDNVSVLLIFPDKLREINQKQSFILGGYIGKE